MNSWGRHPFVRIIVPFIGGILMYVLYQIHFPAAIVFLVAGITLLLHILLRFQLIRNYRVAPFAGLCLQFTILVIANHFCFLKADVNHPTHYLHFIETGDYAVVKLDEPQSEKEKTQKATASLISFNVNNHWLPSCGSVILYFAKDSIAHLLQPGDYVLVRNKFLKISPPKNPDEFDYRKFLAYRQVYASAFLSSSDWRKLPFRNLNPVFQLAFWLQQKSIDALERYVPAERERAVDEALIIGYRDKMSFDVIQSYVAAGVIHVLAVSGLHVAILFGMLQWLLSFMRKKKHGKIFQAIIILMIIWIFTLVTGASGSVIRAATMFTAITIGRSLGRSVSMYNVLACSALVILLYNPFLIMDVGFQLSYVAVIGITSLYPYINGWLYRENALVDNIWKITSVSIAATVATFPLTSFYFNQFPTYFLLANLIVIPLSGIILQAGLALVVLQFIPPLAWLLGKIIFALTWLLNEYIIRIQQLPGSVIHLPYIPVLAAVLLACAIISITRFFIQRRKVWLFSSLIILLMFFITESFTVSRWNAEDRITVYDFRKKTAVEFKTSRKIVAWQSMMNFTEQENYYLKRHHQLTNSCVEETIPFDDTLPDFTLPEQKLFFLDDQFFQFKNFNGVLIRKNPSFNPLPQKVKVDAVIVCGNPLLKIENLLSCFDPSLIICDASNSPARIRYWKKEAEKYQIPLYDVAAEGAFIKSL